MNTTGLSTHEVAKLTGATFRQLDHWVRAYGLLQGGNSGSGNHRTWERDDVLKAAAIGVTSSHLLRTELFGNLATLIAGSDPGLWTPLQSLTEIANDLVAETVIHLPTVKRHVEHVLDTRKETP